jgi:hypothetical protein
MILREGIGKIIILFVVATVAGGFVWWSQNLPWGMEGKLAKEGEVVRRLAPQLYQQEFEVPLDPARDKEQLQEICQKAEEVVNFKVELPILLPEGMKLKKIEAIGARRGKPETAFGETRIEYVDTLGGMMVEYTGEGRGLKIFQGRTDIEGLTGGHEVTLDNGKQAIILIEESPTPMRVLYYGDKDLLLYYVIWSSELSEEELIDIANSI